MPKFLKQNFRKLNKRDNGKSSNPALDKIRRRIIWQAGLAVSTIVLTIVIVFAITAAWKSNVVQTSGLQFQAEAWGFDGNIVVDEGPIAAGPGDAGAVTLSVTNDNTDIASVSMNVSKTELTTSNGYEMQKRLYLYVDTQDVRNDEVMDRVYLNSQEGYTYTLLGGQSLTLSEEIHSDAQLKWQWVYDVLGYYVLGMKTSGGDVAVQEYLRPIEYEYDEATTVFKMEENYPTELISISGTSAGDFLKELSAHDGYKGTIDPDKKLDSGWYPVEVDSSGYGVYAYLCSYGEIERATQVDTDLGKAAAEGELDELFTLKLTVAAQNNLENIEEAASAAALQSAITAGTADVIRLTNNITLADSALEIPADQQVVLDLGGYTITNSTEENLITVSEGASLTMFNGALVGSGSEQAVRSVGADVLLSKIDISNAEYGVVVSDHNSKKGLDSRVHLLNCNVNTSNPAVYVSGNSDASESLSQVVIESSTIYSEKHTAILGYGSTWGSDIQIIDSTVTSNPDAGGAGIYHPQKNSTLTVYNSTVSGYSGVVIKGGTVTISGEKTLITGKGAERAPGFENSGFTDTGDGVYIETNYDHEILLEISGGSKITSHHGVSLQVYKSDAPNVAVKIYNGVFDQEQPEEYIDKNSVQNGSVVTEKG